MCDLTDKHNSVVKTAATQQGFFKFSIIFSPNNNTEASYMSLKVRQPIKSVKMWSTVISWICSILVFLTIKEGTALYRSCDSSRKYRLKVYYYTDSRCFPLLFKECEHGKIHSDLSHFLPAILLLAYPIGENINAAISINFNGSSN